MSLQKIFNSCLIFVFFTALALGIEGIFPIGDARWFLMALAAAIVLLIINWKEIKQHPKFKSQFNKEADKENLGYVPSFSARHPKLSIWLSDILYPFQLILVMLWGITAIMIVFSVIVGLVWLFGPGDLTYAETFLKLVSALDK